MRQFWIQYCKDFRANFHGLNAFFILAIYCLFSFVSSLYFAGYLLRENDVVVSYFLLQPTILALIVPAITIRSWGDEIKSGAIELLITQPISYTKLVLSKFFASFSFFVLLVLTSVPFVIISSYFSIIDVGLTICNYEGLLLCGALFTAVGCFISILNKNNILCYCVALLLLFLIINFSFVSSKNLHIDALNFSYNYKAFLSGLLYPVNFVYFIITTIAILWINVLVIKYKKTTSLQNKRLFWIFICILWGLWCSINESFYFIFDKSRDVTDNKKYTISTQTKDFLSSTEKRINVTLYEAKKQREDTNSSYANYAEFVERFFKQLEHASNGAVRLQVIRVEAFSPLERTLLNNNTPFEEDNMGNKIYMIADFSDNEGNLYRINSFTPLRQNYLESDIMRAIYMFGKDKKNIAIIAENSQLQNITTLKNTLHEFYNVEYYNTIIPYISNEYASVVILNPMYYSNELLFAIDQYVLNGGNVIIFGDYEVLKKEINAPLFMLLRNYGITAPTKHIFGDIENVVSTSFNLATTSDEYKNVGLITVNNKDKIEIKSHGKYKITPILKVGNDVVGTKSEGLFSSEYIRGKRENSNLLSNSTKMGKVFFFNDADLLQDNLYVSDLSKGKNFYQTITFADNLLFLLRILDDASNLNIENKLNYNNNYVVNASSISMRIYNAVKEQYKNKLDNVLEDINIYQSKHDEFYNILDTQGFVSVKSIGNISDIQQKLDDAKNELNKITATILAEYKSLVMILSLFIIFVIPFIFVVLLAIIITFYKKLKLRKIRRLLNNA